jgi:membrane-associated phospholipid phosphatase
MRRAAAAAACLAISTWSLGANAEAPHELRHDVATDATVVATSLVIIVSSEMGKGSLAPAMCRWCDDNLNGLDRGARDAFKWENTRLAARISDGFGLIGAPLVNFGTLFVAGRDGGARSESGVDALLMLEAVGVSGVMNEVVKLTVGRERPFVHALPASEKSRVSHAADNNLSFYSGHTSATMTMAAAGGTIATLRGYRLAPLVWGTGVTISAITGFLRIASDKHYLTDVLAGAAIGAAVGILVPVIFHGRRDEDAASQPRPFPVQPASLPSLVTLGATF